MGTYINSLIFSLQDDLVCAPASLLNVYLLVFDKIFF